MSKKDTILVADDEEDIGRVLGFLLKQKGYEVQVVQSGEEALDIIGRQALDLVITDIRMQGMDGIELLRQTREVSPSTAVIIMTAHASLGTAVEAIRLGAADYIEKPFINEEMLDTVSQVLKRQLEKKAVHVDPDTTGIAGKGFIGGSPRIKEVLAVVEKVAPTRSNVLVLGESGTGKGMLAELIHANSKRKDKHFLSINCSAIPDTLLESELFGYKKGAFTGAVADKPGLIVTADGGTLFLDEIGDMPVGTQSKLLQVIETGTLIPLGDTKSRSVDVRIIAATNRDLEERVKQGHFREDLFYRLDVIELSMPPLRERIEDIEVLMRHFLAQFTRQHNKQNITGFDDDAQGVLLSYGWPGNVRELRNVVERAVLLTEGPVITAAHLPEKLRRTSAVSEASIQMGGASLKDSVSLYERGMIIATLNRNNWDKEAAARELGVDLATLYRKMKKLQIEPPLKH